MSRPDGRARKRRTAIAGALMVAAALGSLVAQAQPGAKPQGPAPAASAKPAASAAPAGSAAPKKGEPDNRINPDTGLPMWHPPIEQPAKAPPEPFRPGHDQARELIERLRREGGLRVADAGEHREPYPRDEHGECKGQGPNDRPKNVNLFHGWLGVNNDKAVPEPSRLESEETGWFSEHFGSAAWWKWRLTPYMYRYESEDECDPRNEPVPLIANLINFGVLLWLFSRFGARPIGEALAKRKRAVMSEIDRAKEIKDSAEERLRHYRRELENLDERLAQLREEYALEGQVEEKRLVEDMSQAQARLMADAAFRIEQETKTARDRLSHDALEHALGAAEKLLGAKVQPADHDRLCEEFLDRLGAALANGKGSKS